MESELKFIYTIGQVAKHLNEPLHRVEYAIKSREIEASAIAGKVRVFTENDIKLVAQALRSIDAKREGGTK